MDKDFYCVAKTLKQKGYCRIIDVLKFLLYSYPFPPYILILTDGRKKALVKHCGKKRRNCSK